MVRTLRGRLTLLACLATIPAFLFVLFVATRERGAALRRAESDARYVAGLATREHAHQLMGARRLLDRLATSEKGAPSDATSLQRILPTILSGFPQFANLGVLTREGKLAYSVVEPVGTVDMSQNPAFIGALQSKEVVLGRYQMGQIVGRPVLILARAMRDASGNTLAVLFAALDLDWLDQLARQASLPPDYAIVITDSDGRILARSAGLARHVDAKNGSIAIPDLAKASASAVRVFGDDGLERLFVASPMEGVPDLFVAVGLPVDRVVGMANRAFVRAVLALAVLTLLTVASSVIAADLSVLRDLRALAGTTRLFGGGDLAARAPMPQTHGEIRDLAHAFNAMADALALRHEEVTIAGERMRALSHALQAAREEEGTRIARELHDQLGQELTILKMDLASAKRKVHELGPPAEEVEKSLEQARTRIDASVDSIRRISSELRPSVLDRLGLAAGLEWLLREFERRTSLSCTLEACDVDDAIDAEVSTALFRITQEALTNVARHARAKSVVVELEDDGETLILRVKDDGRGMNVDKNDRRVALGLLGMQERASLLGGRLEVTSTAGDGTMVTARVPKLRKRESRA